MEDTISSSLSMACSKVSSAGVWLISQKINTILQEAASQLATRGSASILTPPN
jgi:hypothetical protein